MIVRRVLKERIFVTADEQICVRPIGEDETMRVDRLERQPILT